MAVCFISGELNKKGLFTVIPYDPFPENPAGSSYEKITKEEWRFWQMLRNCSRDFTRQESIGNYIVDFFCKPAKLIVEIQKKKNGLPVEYNQKKKNDLESMGYIVKVYTYIDIHHRFEKIKTSISQIIHERIPEKQR
jgi:very-short-patch-repair endonuclease